MMCLARFRAPPVSAERTASVTLKLWIYSARTEPRNDEHLPPQPARNCCGYGALSVTAPATQSAVHPYGLVAGTSPPDGRGSESGRSESCAARPRGRLL